MASAQWAIICCAWSRFAKFDTIEWQRCQVAEDVNNRSLGYMSVFHNDAMLSSTMRLSPKPQLEDGAASKLRLEANVS